MALSLMMHWQLSGKLLLEVCTWVLLPTVVHDSDTTASFEKGGGGTREESCHVPVAVWLRAACLAPNSNICHEKQCACCLCKMYTAIST